MFLYAEVIYKESLASFLQTHRNTRKWLQPEKWLIGKGRETYPPLYAGSDQFTSNKEEGEASKKFFLSHSYVGEANPQLPDEYDFSNGCNNVVSLEQGVYDLIH